MYYGSPAGEKNKPIIGGGISKVRLLSSISMRSREADTGVTEQALEQRREESLCNLLQLLRHMQDKDGTRKKILPEMCLQSERLRHVRKNHEL